MISVHVPATSANCCVGFDCLGMAVDWWAHFTFEESDTLMVKTRRRSMKGRPRHGWKLPEATHVRPVPEATSRL